MSYKATVIRTVTVAYRETDVEWKNCFSINVTRQMKKKDGARLIR